MANITLLPSGKYRALVRTLGVYDSDTFLTMKEAELWGAKREEEIRAGKTAKVNTTATVGEMLKTFLSVVASKTDSAKWNGLRINKWLTDPLAVMRVVEVKPHDINLWIERRKVGGQHGRKLSDATVSRELTLLSSAFTYGVKSLKWIEVNPCHGAQRPPEGKARNRPLMTADEVKAICIATGYNDDPDLRTLTARVGATFLLALETGARSGELLRVKPEHYRRDRRTLRIAAEEQGGRKGTRSGTLSSARDVPLTGRAIELLDQLMEHRIPDQPYVIGLNDSQRDILWRKARDRAGVEDLHFHDMKHEAATRLSKFLDVFALSHALGTKDIQLLRNTYYVNDASAQAALLPDRLLDHAGA